MTDSTDDPDLVLLGELLAGDRAETDAEVAAMLQRRKDLHGEWQRLRGLCERLERTGHRGWLRRTTSRSRLVCARG